MAASRIFAVGDSSEIGLYDSPSETGLPGLWSGIMTAVFHTAGISKVWSERLKSFVRNCIPSSPNFLSIRGESWSGPRAFDGFVFRMASLTSAWVIWKFDFVILRKIRRVFLLALSILVGCSTNSLLKQLHAFFGIHDWDAVEMNCGVFFIVVGFADAF